MSGGGGGSGFRGDEDWDAWKLESFTEAVSMENEVPGLVRRDEDQKLGIVSDHPIPHLSQPSN